MWCVLSPCLGRTPKCSVWIVKTIVHVSSFDQPRASLPRFEFVTGLIIFANLITVGVELELALSTPVFELLGRMYPWRARVNHFGLKPQSLWGFGVSSQILGLARSLPVPTIPGGWLLECASRLATQVRNTAFSEENSLASNCRAHLPVHLLRWIVFTILVGIDLKSLCID